MIEKLKHHLWLCQIRRRKRRYKPRKRKYFVTAQKYRRLDSENFRLHRRLEDVSFLKFIGFCALILIGVTAFALVFGAVVHTLQMMQSAGML
jgi:hypothetical protein